MEDKREKKKKKVIPESSSRSRSPKILMKEGKLPIQGELLGKKGVWKSRRDCIDLSGKEPISRLGGLVRKN